MVAGFCHTRGLPVRNFEISTQTLYLKESLNVIYITTIVIHGMSIYQRMRQTKPNKTLDGE